MKWCWNAFSSDLESMKQNFPTPLLEMSYGTDTAHGSFNKIISELKIFWVSLYFQKYNK